MGQLTAGRPPLERPGAIVDRLNTELRKAMNDPDVATKLSAQTLDPAHRPPEELAQRLNKLPYTAIRYTRAAVS